MWQELKQWLSPNRQGWLGCLLSAVCTVLMVAVFWLASVQMPIGPFMLVLAVYCAYRFGLAAGLISVMLTVLTTRPVLPLLASLVGLPEPNPPWLMLTLAFIITGIVGSLVADRVLRGKLRLESEKKLHQSTLANISDAVIHTNAAGGIEYLNPAAIQLLGLKLENALHQPFESVVDIRDEQANKPLGLIDAARAAGSTMHPSGGQLLVRTDGAEIPVEAVAAPVRNDVGELSGVVLTIRNCTEQRRIDKVLRERLALQSRLERIAAVVPGALMEFQVHSEGRISLSYASASFKEILGIEPESCAADCTAMLACVHSEDLEHVRQVVAEAIAELTPINLEHRWLTSHRGLRWISMTITPSFELEHSRLWHGLMLDITERKRAEESLRTSQLQLQAALQSGDMGVLEMDLTTNQVQMDATGKRSWGFSDSQTDLTVDDMMRQVHADDLPGALAYHREISAQPMQYEREYHLQLPGEERWLLCRGRVYREEVSGNLIKMGVMIDTTQQRRMQQQRLHSQKLEAMGILAGGIAHDFNNLLLAISGNTKLLLADLADTDPRRDSAREIEKAAARAADLVRRILSFSSVPEPARAMQPLPLRPMLDEVLGLARAVIPATVKINNPIAEQLPAVNADSSQVHQVLINLLTNAADAAPSTDPCIDVTAEVIAISADQPQQFAELKPGHYVRVSVADNGRGMDRVAMQRIFDPFYSTKAPGRGTGLGLAIVHGIMRTLGGGVTVNSAPGKGATFAVYFPISLQQPAALPAAQPVRPEGRALHILFVDDEEALVLLMTRTLERLGHAVTACSSPEAAAELFAKQPRQFDVVISDMSMPGMSGIELAKRILALNANVPFIITSGYLDADDINRAQAVGVRQMILKPNTVEELTTALLAIVPYRQAAAAGVVH